MSFAGAPKVQAVAPKDQRVRDWFDRLCPTLFADWQPPQMLMAE
jgi:hypothetical protein